MPLRIIDETGANTVVEVADGGQSIGFAGAPNSSQYVTLNGVTFIAGNSRFGSAIVQSLSTNPVSGSVSVAANSDQTISVSTAPVPVTGDGSQTNTTDPTTAISSSSFTFHNSGSTSATFKYNYF